MPAVGWMSTLSSVPAPDAPPLIDSGENLVLHLDGFDGPMDLLLDLARAQKVDLAKISILSLVDQYLAVIEGARRVRLELAADWLVMAAWLTWLKSRLLVPAAANDDLEDGTMAAEALAERLRGFAPPAPRYKTGVFAKYAALVSSAEDGAITTPDSLKR